MLLLYIFCDLENNILFSNPYDTSITNIRSRSCLSFTVPAYEVISPHSIAKRDADGAHRVRLKAFGEHHDLQLEPSDGLLTGDKLRAWAAHHNSTTDTVHYTELPNDVSI